MDVPGQKIGSWPLDKFAVYWKRWSCQQHSAVNAIKEVLRKWWGNNLIVNRDSKKTSQRRTDLSWALNRWVGFQQVDEGLTLQVRRNLLITSGSMISFDLSASPHPPAPPLVPQKNRPYLEEARGRLLPFLQILWVRSLDFSFRIPGICNL